MHIACAVFQLCKFCLLVSGLQVKLERKNGGNRILDEVTGVASEVVKVQGEDLATPGPLKRNDPGTVTIPQYRVNTTKQHTHTHTRGQARVRPIDKLEEACTPAHVWCSQLLSKMRAYSPPKMHMDSCMHAYRSFFATEAIANLSWVRKHRAGCRLSPALAAPPGFSTNPVTRRCSLKKSVQIHASSWRGCRCSVAQASFDHLRWWIRQEAVEIIELVCVYVCVRLSSILSCDSRISLLRVSLYYDLPVCVCVFGSVCGCISVSFVCLAVSEQRVQQACIVSARILLLMHLSTNLYFAATSATSRSSHLDMKEAWWNECQKEHGRAICAFCSLDYACCSFCSYVSCCLFCSHVLSNFPNTLSSLSFNNYMVCIVLWYNT